MNAESNPTDEKVNEMNTTNEVSDLRARLRILANDYPVGSIHHNTVEQAIAALSALPAASGEAWQPISTVPRDGTRVVVWMPDGTFSSASYNAHSEPQGVYWMIPSNPTPPPPADAEELGPHPLNICPKCKDYYMDCECPADAAVGAQGEWPMFTWSGLALRKLGELRKQGWAVNGYALYRNGERGLIDLHGAVHWIATPAAGKGVDAEAIETIKRIAAQLATEDCEGDAADLIDAMHALTRQPVADGEFVAGSSSPGTVRGSATQWLTRAEAWREILHYVEQYEQDGAVTILEVTRRPLAATPTDGGEGK